MYIDEVETFKQAAFVAGLFRPKVCTRWTPAPYAVESQFIRATALHTSFMQHVRRVVMTWPDISHQLGSVEARGVLSCFLVVF